MLLLNRVLTVAPGRSGSHRGKGWEQVTQRAIEALVARGGPLVAILWGRDAQTLVPMLGDVPYLASAHPSPLSARSGFFGSRPFSRANDLLVRQGGEPIDWAPDRELGDAAVLPGRPCERSAASVMASPISAEEAEQLERSTERERSSAQRLVQVGDQVADVLEADAEPDQVAGDLERGARHRGVGHPARVLDQRLDPAQRLGQGEHLGPAAGVDGGLLAARTRKADHAAEPAHLPLGHVVLGVDSRPG